MDLRCVLPSASRQCPRAVLRNMLLKPVAAAEELSLPLLAARMADLPYQVESAEDVAASLKTLLVDAKLLHFQQQALMDTNAVWFLCSGRISESAEPALFLVFRGTMSPTDAIADVLFRPEAGPNGVRCHGGFYVRRRRQAATAAKHLAAARAQLGFGCGDGAFDEEAFFDGQHGRRCAGVRLLDMYIRSLAWRRPFPDGCWRGFLPKGLRSKLTIVTLGGPVVFYGDVDASLLDAASASAKVISIVNANDVVPRLLGCPLSFSRSVLDLFASSNNKRKHAEQEEVIDTLEQYRGFPGYELLFLHGAKAYPVPPRHRGLVLQLAEALHPRAIADHLTYVAAAEAAAGAEPWAATLSAE